ncbi:ATP-dependent DNA helicase PIF1-like [Chelonus insularis]|uniref:ATP-dependent DNA helicase PIF1-like n=1 Tax=Chelonus insularis TaxID=460826 RepID=UPI00158B0B74|nr:ATP-dependent DNA helicase PIF1-like [Chelonus insularis]
MMKNLTTKHSGNASYTVTRLKLSSDLANNIREQLCQVQLIIIDGISMVGSTVLGYVNTRLRQITGVNEPFGGLSVLAVGDLNQLPPVKDKPVYQVSNQNQMAPLIDINPLWDQFVFYELTEIMRQKNDRAFINALNNLALGTMKTDDINLIKCREIKNINDIPETAIRLYATNKNVSSYNAQRISQCKSKLFTSTAQVVFSKDITEGEKKIILRSINKKANNIAIELPDVIQLKVNIKYMIIKNIDVEDGLVNGACGILKYIECKDANIPSTLWLDFHTPRVGINIRARHRDYMTKNNIDNVLTPIERISIQTSVAQDDKYKILKNQFPIIPAEAITIHKSQGQTYVKICLDFTAQERQTLSMLYVALSRVTKLSGLFIIG